MKNTLIESLAHITTVRNFQDKGALLLPSGHPHGKRAPSRNAIEVGCMLGDYSSSSIAVVAVGHCSAKRRHRGRSHKDASEYKLHTTRQEVDRRKTEGVALN